jgi:cytochrome c oxidase subunit III
MGATANANTPAPYYFVPNPSKWPMVGAIAMLFWGFGAAGFVNEVPFAGYSLLAGLGILFYMMYGWFGNVAGESESGTYNSRVDLSFRWSMSWFIFSEVMFFAGFFGALFYARVISMPWLGDLDHRMMLWPDFNAAWPNTGPSQLVDAYQKMSPFWLPTINTLILLTSGVTLTIAHHALKENKRGPLKFWLFMTVLLGAIFMLTQGYEYVHAYQEMNLKLTSGIYGSTFFMLTGFHGFHVTLGAIMLAVILVRVMKGHFTPEHHFGFEGAAWYWHFVDVVWLLLYVVVYWL